jgi:hypothetical protein
LQNDPFLSQYAQQRAHPELLGAPFQHQRDVSNDSAVDSTMEVDYVSSPGQDISMAIDPATIVPVSHVFISIVVCFYSHYHFLSLLCLWQTVFTRVFRKKSPPPKVSLLGLISEKYC